jgi:hypothetical protein
MAGSLRGSALSALVALGCLVTPAAAATRAGHGFEAPEPAPPMDPEAASEFARLSPLLADDLLAARGMQRSKPKEKKPKEGTAAAAADSTAAPAEAEPAGKMGGIPAALSGERVQVMLQSLTVPGWGQASMGQNRSALVFGLVELGIWGTYAAFQVQEHMRQKTYERTAFLFGGIDLGGRDEEYKRLVGLYASSEEYNRLVVRRDATNLYYGDPAAYNAYVAANQISGADAWAWRSEGDFQRYRTERQEAQRAAKHAQDALAAALINRLVSVIHAARGYAHRPPDATSWRLEYAPEPGDPTAFRVALRADF